MPYWDHNRNTGRWPKSFLSARERCCSQAIAESRSVEKRCESRRTC